MSRGTILVTGARGFIGTHVVRHLRSKGFAVRGLVRGEAGNCEFEPFLCRDLEDEAAIEEAMRGVEHVVHLAARVHVMSETANDALEQYRRVNVEGTRVLVRGAEAAGVKRFVFLSSVKAVGEDSGEDIWDESTPAAPLDPYGVSKLEAENLIAEAARTRGFHAVTLRVPLVYGPGMRANMLRLFEIVRRGVPLPLARIRNRRSLLYVGNLTAAIEAAISPERGKPGVYFLSDGVDLSTAELIRNIASGFGVRPRLVPVPQKLIEVAGKIGDRISRVLPWPLTSPKVRRLTSSLAINPHRFFEEFDFEPPYSPQQGLQATARWMAGQGATINE